MEVFSPDEKITMDDEPIGGNHQSEPQRLDPKIPPGDIEVPFQPPAAEKSLQREYSHERSDQAVKDCEKEQAASQSHRGTTLCPGAVSIGGFRNYQEGDDHSNPTVSIHGDPSPIGSDLVLQASLVGASGRDLGRHQSRDSFDGLVAAEAVKTPSLSSRRKRKLLFLAMTLGALLICGGVITGVVFGVVLETTNDAPVVALEVSIAPSAPPSMPPTREMGPQEFIDRLNGLVPTFSSSAIANDPRSPQALAAQRITLDGNFSNYLDWQILQRFAMAVIYHATGGPTWTNNTGWLDYSLDDCTWFIIPGNNPCSNGRRRVLDLERNNLDGVLPPEIGLLSDMDALELVGNRLGGPIPSEVGWLTALRTFNLLGNHWTGALPTTVGLMTNLTSFDIDDASLQCM